MNHCGTKIIESERLLLRKFTMQDAEAMYTNWASDPEVTKFLIWQHHSSVEVSKEILTDWAGHYSEQNYYNWAIVLKENGSEVIGSIGAVYVDDRTKTVRIGYCIGQKWWHQGIVSEALSLLVKFFFEEVGVNRIESYHDPNNQNSGGVMKKCGLQYEGTLKEADCNNQGVCDTVWYAILASDYTS
jgi:Acetyltransferases, including N-acetylases of ribosomal proteins